jgi:hypothetical protein
MGSRFYRRIPLGGGAGVNISKSGISTSFRGKFGSLGSSGFSIRSGIPGLSFRSGWGSSSKRGGLDKLQTHISENSDSSEREFIVFSTEKVPELFKDTPFYLQEIIAKNGQLVGIGDDICSLAFLDTSEMLQSNYNGIITWYKLPGQQLVDGAYYASIEYIHP